MNPKFSSSGKISKMTVAGRRRQRPCVLLLMMLILLTFVPSIAVEYGVLDEFSVVLITGAAGFIGSELAMALHRTYHPKKMLLVDSMETLSHDGSFNDDTTKKYRNDQDLALFEFKRQRIFHVLQTIGSSAYFYRVDIRPSIPEHFDNDVPVLDHIFQQHPDITHIVHLADPYHRGVLQLHQDPNKITTQAIPRHPFQQNKAGLMEGLLEQLVKMKNEVGRVPHFTFASSYEVYNHLQHMEQDESSSKRKRPMSEDLALTTPSSLAGASKLVDEILAQTYYQTHGIFSVALRFFCVYGPWGLPGSPLFVMSERAVTGESPLLPEETPNDIWDDVRDYVYIDDAVDAIMSAMQFRPSPNSNLEPVAINVGTGQGRTLREIADKIIEFFPQMELPEEAAEQPHPPTVSVASTERARHLLGFEAQVSFSRGLENLLSWHYDRAFPYGDGSTSASDTASTRKEDFIATQGIVACNGYDTECLRGTPAFPCASECAHAGQCTTSFYDDVVDFTRQLTSDCSVVMYTVALDNDISVIPSAEAQVSINSKSYVEDGEYCNIAFVSDASPLVRRLQSQKKSVKFPVARSNQAVLMHGFWAIIPVTVTQFAAERKHILKLLPKLSPGQFFSNKTVKAIYADPNVIFDSVPQLLLEAQMQPFSEDVEGATAMLIGKDVLRAERHRQVNVASAKSTVQEQAYRTMRMALIEELEENAYAQHVDSSFVVHTINNEDSRLFRCDVFGDVVQWDVASDVEAFQFIMNLHDMWSRVLVEEAGQTPWWIGDEVESIPEDKHHRRLSEQGQSRNPDLADTWMGVLSSTEVQNFARIVLSSTLGVVHLDDYPTTGAEEEGSSATKV